jgi:hypothetical protein
MTAISCVVGSQTPRFGHEQLIIDRDRTDLRPDSQSSPLALVKAVRWAQRVAWQALAREG